MTKIYEELYKQKLTTPEEAIQLVEPGDGIVYPLGAGEPSAIHKALANYENLDGNRLYTMLTMNPVIDLPKEKLRQISFFLSGSDRKAFNTGKTELIPSQFSEIPNIVHEREPDPVLIRSEPSAIHKALANYENLDGNRLYTMLTMNPVIDLPKEKLRQISFFLSGSDRKAFNTGKTELIPSQFSEIPNIVHEREPDPVLIATVSPMDEDGYFSLGVGVSYFGSQIEHAKKIIIEVNETMPYTYGIKNHIHISQVDALVENNHPIPSAPEPKLNEKDKKIGSIIADMIHDGDTIQVGIGAIPNAVMNNLKDKKNLGLHSEMFTSKAQLLHEEGVLVNTKKQNFKGVSIATFAFGP